MSTQAVMRSHVLAAKLGLNPTDLEALEILFRYGTSTAGSLAKATGLTTGAVTGVIDRLSRAGFVARELDPDDRRKILVALNLKKVSEEVLTLYESIANSIGALLETYSEVELDLILDFLKKTNAVSQEDLRRLGENGDT